MRTNTRVHFGLCDVTAKGDGQAACGAAQPFCNVGQDLALEAVPEQLKYGTLETGQFWMDGSYALFPDEPEGQFWGLWSSQPSGPDGRFAQPPVLDLDFDEPHSSAGITLHFYAPTGDWATDVLLEWLGPAGELLATKRFYPDSVDYYCPCKAQGYRKARLTFYATNRPGRYLKLAGLDYGVALTFAGEEVVEAHLLEEVDPLSSEVSVNTLQLILYNRAGSFSLLNPNGFFDLLQHKQRFTVYEDVQDKSGGTASHNMGTFYLSEWENTSETLARFTATDAVGLLDSAPFDGGIYDTTAQMLAAEILEGYDYLLDPALAQQPVRGYLPIGTRRDALQQLAFALGAVVDCSRGGPGRSADRRDRSFAGQPKAAGDSRLAKPNDVPLANDGPQCQLGEDPWRSRGGCIRICPPPERPSGLIGQDRKFVGGRVSLRPLITGVEVTGHQYLPAAEQEELFADTLAPGEYRVTFDAPAAEIRAEGGTLLQAGSNFAVAEVTQAGPVRLLGRKYLESKTTALCRPPSLPANAAENILRVEGATLVGPSEAETTARRVLDYYANRYEMEFEMLAGAELLADMLVVEAFGGERLRGVLERMELDLTGGFLARVRLVGQRLDSGAGAYTGEIFTKERGLI